MSHEDFGVFSAGGHTTSFICIAAFSVMAHSRQNTLSAGYPGTPLTPSSLRIVRPHGGTGPHPSHVNISSATSSPLLHAVGDEPRQFVALESGRFAGIT